MQCAVGLDPSPSAGRARLGRSPDTASFEDVRRFQLHLAANGAHIPVLNHTVAALCLLPWIIYLDRWPAPGQAAAQGR